MSDRLGAGAAADATDALYGSPEEAASTAPSAPSKDDPAAKRRAQRETFEGEQAIRRRTAGHPESQPPPGNVLPPETDERNAADRGPKRADEEDGEVSPDEDGPEGRA